MPASCRNKLSQAYIKNAPLSFWIISPRGGFPRSCAAYCTYSEVVYPKDDETGAGSDALYKIVMRIEEKSFIF